MNKKRILTIILCFALLFTVGGEVFTAFAIKASAEAREYSDVLDDLSKDENFNPYDYPAIADDYSLKVIQIAEGSDGELFVYVYQPSSSAKLLIASSIVISTEVSTEDRDYDEYNLSLISLQGVFHKYRVDGFAIKNDSTRFYSISQIFRPFDSSIDVSPEDDNTISFVYSSVGCLWKVTDINGILNYECSYEDLITVDNKHVGYIEYDGGTFWFDNDMQSHYVAFSTNHNIDSILEIEMSYKYVTYKDYGYFNVEEYGPYMEEKVYSKEEVFEINTSGFFPQTYKYNRIQSIEAFLENEGTSAMKESLSNMQWVLRFFETETEWGLTYNPDSMAYSGYNLYSEVSNVVLFRIMYEYDGVVYNLGVLDNKQSGDNNPDGNVTPDIDFEEWFEKLLAVLGFILIVVLFVALSGPITFLLNGLWGLLKFVFWLIGTIILMPFKVIGRFFKK